LHGEPNEYVELNEEDAVTDGVVSEPTNVSDVTPVAVFVPDGPEIDTPEVEEEEEQKMEEEQNLPGQVEGGEDGDQQ